MPQQFDRLIRIAAITVIAGGCFLVLRPFVAAILFAAIVCTTTWPVFSWLRRALGDHPTTAALLLICVMVAVVIVPMVMLAGALAQYTGTIVEYVRSTFAEGTPALPAWLVGLPVVGEQIDEYWHSLTESREALIAAARGLVEPVRGFLLALGALVGEGVLQLALVAFISFFFYRDGEAIMRALETAVGRLAGGMAQRLTEIVDATVRGVVYGILGTAIAQALVALVGFLIAGVPLAFLLATATFFLSMVPVGPPLVWGGAAAWLANEGSYGWAIFMGLYGLLVISSIDNFIKPWLISRGSAQPIAIVFLGVLGGVLAFGFIGIFLGPVLLAVTFSILKRWTETAAQFPPPPPPDDTPTAAGG